MTSWIGPLGVVADVFLLVALAAAVASPGVSQLGRPVIATFAFACAWVTAAAVDALRAPGWTIFLGAAVIVVSILAITATLHLWTQGGEGGDVRPGPRGVDGGGGPPRRPPDDPQPGGDDSAPAWWAEFERQFASYVDAVPISWR